MSPGRHAWGSFYARAGRVLPGRVSRYNFYFPQDMRGEVCDEELALLPVRVVDHQRFPNYHETKKTVTGGGK